MTLGFDPEGPLPGAPEPWAASSMPLLRPAPPYLMTEMIAAEPALAARLAQRVAHDPTVNHINPFELWDTSILRAIDDSEYIDELYGDAKLAANPTVNAAI